MKKSIDNLAFKVPDSMDKSHQVQAWFSLKNSDKEAPAGIIKGLNVGFNTPEVKKVVTENRMRLGRALNLDSQQIAYAGQVHSNNVQTVSRGGTYPRTDALVTHVSGLTLAIQVADCAAVLLWDDLNNIIAAAHAGWKGAVGHIVPLTIKRMISLGAEPQQIKAYVSPCISFKNFEVGTSVAKLFPGKFVDYENFNKPHINIKGFITSQMEDSGVLRANIEVDEDCTIEKEELYYSYRREGKMSGRMAGLIRMVSR